MNATDPRHGTSAGYVAGCRCEPCWTAKQRYDKRRRWEALQGFARKVPSLGSARRLHALRAVGWSLPTIAQYAGMSRSQLEDVGRYPTVYRATAHNIAAVYERLCMQTPPATTPAEKHGVTKSRRTAERNGWPPPLAWTDIDDPDEQPTDWAYTEPTRAELLAELDDHGAGLTEVCRRLGVGREALEKWASRNGMAATFSRLVAREQPDYERFATGRRAS